MQKELFPVVESYRTDFEGETRECRTCSVVKELAKFPPASYVSGKDCARKHSTCYACFAKSKSIRIKHTLDYPNPKDTDYKCPICCKNQEELTTHGRYTSDLWGNKTNGMVWHLDHCHTTGNYRGWLCSGCNKGLGSFNDDPDCLQRAIEYLERSINDN